MLMLVWLYNACSDEGETETQQEILELITYQDGGCLRFKLENASIGEYLHLVIDDRKCKKIKLEIDSLKDIFGQTRQFLEAWNTIAITASDMRAKNPDITLDEYKQKLLDCEVLLFSQKTQMVYSKDLLKKYTLTLTRNPKNLILRIFLKGIVLLFAKQTLSRNRSRYCGDL